MKILGHVNTEWNPTYIVEMTESEIVRAAGCQYSSGAAWKAVLEKAGVAKLCPGAKINVEPLYAWYDTLVRNEAAALEAAKKLIELAEQITKAVPMAVIPFDVTK